MAFNISWCPQKYILHHDPVETQTQVFNLYGKPLYFLPYNLLLFEIYCDHYIDFLIQQ